MKKLCLFAAALILTACQVSPTAPHYADAPKPELSGGKAVLYVYREYAEPTAFKAFITDADRKIVSLPQKAFSWVYLDPGEHQLMFGWPMGSGMPDLNFKARVEAGKVYVFEMLSDLDVGGYGQVNGVSGMLLTTTMEVRGMDPDVASALMTKCCQYVKPKTQ
jgi:hypothetical protein